MHYKHPRDPGDVNNGCVSVTFFAKDKDQLPHFKRVGDIIRIHRANIGSYKNYKTFSVNLAFGSSWVIFSGFPSTKKTVEDGIPNYAIEPSSASSCNYSLAPIDVEMVKKYREWLADYFMNEFNYESTLYMNLNKVRDFIAHEVATKTTPTYPTPREYDLVVRLDIVQDPTPEQISEVLVNKDDGYTPGFVRNAEATKAPVYKILQISDSTSLVFDLWVPESVIPENMAIGDVIRVKSCISGPL